MKKFVLFSTNNSVAIDNVSFAIEYETQAQLDELNSVSKYSFMTFAPIGTPEGGALTFEEGLNKIKNLKLHKEIFTLKATSTSVVEFSKDLKEHIIITLEDNIPIIRFKHSFRSDDATLMSEEARYLSELVDMFKLNIAYKSNRGTFLIRNYTECFPKGSPNPKRMYDYKYTVCDGRLIEVNDIYQTTIVEL